MSGTAPARARAGAPEDDVEHRLSQAFEAYVDADTSLVHYATRHPRIAAQVLQDLRRLPLHHADLPPAVESGAVRDLLMAHGTSRRLMRGVSAVLETPDRPGGSLDGARRATLRRKVRAAERRGVTVSEVPFERRGELIALADRHEQQNELAAYRVARPDNGDLLDYDLWLAALDAEGNPIVLAVIPTAGQWGALRYLRTLVPGPTSSDARYLMVHAIAETLAARGVRHLVDTARPHWLPNGLRHFQRMVGFRLVRVSRVRVEEH